MAHRNRCSTAVRTAQRQRHFLIIDLCFECVRCLGRTIASARNRMPHTLRLFSSATTDRRSCEFCAHPLAQSSDASALMDCNERQTTSVVPLTSLGGHRWGGGVRSGATTLTETVPTESIYPCRARDQLNVVHQSVRDEFPLPSNAC